MDLNHLDWILGGLALVILGSGLVMLLSGVNSLNRQSKP
ncbi:MAG: NAD synthetase [Microcystaceae cyanobacterium]